MDPGYQAKDLYKRASVSGQVRHVVVFSAVVDFEMVVMKILGGEF